MPINRKNIIIISLTYLFLVFLIFWRIKNFPGLLALGRGGKTIPNADAATFQILENGKIEDHYATYSYDGKRIEK